MNRPRVTPPLPGPLADRLIARDRFVSSPSLIKEYPLVVRRARGMIVEDLDGNRFLDFMGGIAVAATGHCHPTVVRAIRKQSGDLLHICGTDFFYPGYTELCERLADLAPGNQRWKVFLSNSGAEAVEGAIKLARFHSGRKRIIAFTGAFHGRTYGAMTLTMSKSKQREGFDPFLPGIHHLPYGHCFRCAYGLQYPSCDVHCIDGWRDTIFANSIPPSEVAAIIVEPIQGEGGYIVPPPDYFPRLRKLCDDYGILLIADEVQSGVGRTGKWFAMEHWNVVPDIVTLAKGLGSGMPIGAVMAKSEVMTWPPGSHGSTFGGNPVCCAAALATLEVIEKEGLLKNATEVGTYLLDRLLELKATYAAIGDVRGIGLMLALEFVDEQGQPAPDLSKRFELGCFESGLLVLGCGESAIRFAPPLMVTQKDARKGLGIIQRVLKRMFP